MREAEDPAEEASRSHVGLEATVGHCSEGYKKKSDGTSHGDVTRQLTRTSRDVETDSRPGFGASLSVSFQDRQ
jgi:hypothetical protein